MNGMRTNVEVVDVDVVVVVCTLVMCGVMDNGEMDIGDIDDRRASVRGVIPEAGVSVSDDEVVVVVVRWAGGVS